MTNWPVHAHWNGPIVMIGFGSIGRGTLPLILRHIACDRARITIVDPDASWSHLAEKEGIAFVKEAVTRKNHRTLLAPLLTAGPGPAFIVNLSVEVCSLDIIKLAQELKVLYVDTVVEPWPGFYFDSKLGPEARTNYALRENVLDERRRNPGGSTAVSCCGANPGMVSFMVKQALLDVALDVRHQLHPPRPAHRLRQPRVGRAAA